MGDRGTSVNTPPYFDGTNYSQWKIMMTAFLVSQDDGKQWSAVEDGWKIPERVTTLGSAVSVQKPRAEWTEPEKAAARMNIKALNSLYSALSEGERKRIITCLTAKHAWEVLLTTYEGNEQVREQKLQNLMLEFDDLKMSESESIDEFHSRVLSIVKLEVKIPEDVEYSVEECAFLTNNLRTFLRKEKFFSPGRNFSNPRSGETSQDRYPKNPKSGEFPQDRNQNRNSNFRTIQKGDGTCFECGGRGHRAVDCGNRKVHSQKPQKAYVATWSDDEEDFFDDQEEDTVAFVARYVPESSLIQNEEHVSFVATVSLVDPPEDEEDDEDRMQKFTELVGASKSMLSKIDVLTKALAKSEEQKAGIQADLSSQQEKWKVDQKNKQGLGFETGEGSKNNGTVFVKSREPIVSSLTNKVEPSKRFKPICHYCGIPGHIRPFCRKLKNSHPNPKRDQTVADMFSSFQASLEKSLQEFARIAKSLSGPSSEKTHRNPSWVKKSDTRSRALKASQKYPKPYDICGQDSEEEIICFFSRVMLSLEPAPESRTVAVCRIALTALTARRSDSWYVDSGCSRHMIGDPKWFTSMDDTHLEGNVGFGDGAKAPIIGCGTVNAPGLPSLKDVLLVKGLEVSLLSVSQIVDEHESVTFDRSRCVVLDGKGKNIMRGERTRSMLLYCS
uniref:uncharacterized protein LOC105351877 n=1 Tax=Fragaria vesca subsp. vesca TaxID=101020 RepID=UPI0005CA8AFB|nr:PREDICTED: uncharacterized protein LOC105351877 [Fragaria vesca subsp. vesca]